VRASQFARSLGTASAKLAVAEPIRDADRVMNTNPEIVHKSQPPPDAAFRDQQHPGRWMALLPSLLALLFLAPSCFGAESQRFVQDRFAIGFWVAPQTGENLEQRYREIADAHFTLVVGTAGMSAEEQLKLCQRLGLRAIVNASGPASQLPDNEACWGYLVVDEPGAAAFPELAKRAAEIRRERPGRFGYINLFPNYASPAQLGTATYEEHVAEFVRLVKPEVLSMDHYPAMRPDNDTRDAYRANLETMRKHSLSEGIPFWNYFYSMPFNDRLDPTEAQIRWQIYTSVAYGAKGVLYFCYWTPGKGAGGAGEFPKGGAILTAEGARTRHYDEARRINAELKNLGPSLMKLTSTGVYRVNTEKNPAAALEGSPLRSLARVRTDPPADYLIGAFRHADGRRAVLIVNDSHAYTGWPTVEFDAEAEQVLEVDKATGREVKAIDDSPELKGFQISLGAGDARLFLLPPRK
jgi:hypothetical protein